VREYDGLVAECLGTSREAVLRQHRAEALLAHGDVGGAVEEFTLVVELGRKADPVLLASAEQGLALARGQATAAQPPLS
jgi:hypothetical protein